MQELNSSSRQNDEAAREETCPSNPSKPTPAKTSLLIQLVSFGCMDQLEGPRGGGGKGHWPNERSGSPYYTVQLEKGHNDELVKDATKSR